MAASHPLHNVVIAGAFNSVQARVLPGETSASITLKAVRGALDEAGIAPAEVDGMSVSSGVFSNSVISPHGWIRLFGGNDCWIGSAMGIAGILEAASAIAAGYCNTVVVGSGQAGAYLERQSTAPWTRPSNEFVECYGLYTAAEFALIARRHMHLYGTKPEHLAEVASTIRNNGSTNPEAVYAGKGPFTSEEILSSRMVADPYHLLDCATTSEGATALVLTRADRARDLKAKPVYVLGGGNNWRGPAYVGPPVWDEAGLVGRFGAQNAFRAAGLGPSEVDVCEFYDPFSFEIIRQFEAFGFCPEGEGGEFVMDGRIGLRGQYPICTDGGTMSFSHPGTAQFLQRVVAGVKQIRGTAGPNQVDDVNVAMASNGGAGAYFNDVMIIGSAPR